MEGKGLRDLTRYFDLQTKWDNEQYRLITGQDAIFLSEARKCYAGESIGTLYYLWKRNQLPKDIQNQAAAESLPMQKILFRTLTLQGHETIFGDSTKRWGDGWQIRGCSGAASPRRSLSKPTESLQKTADT